MRCLFKAFPGKAIRRKFTLSRLQFSYRCRRIGGKLSQPWVPSPNPVRYASAVYQTKLTDYGMICSKSPKGNCWDNAPTENLLNSLKNKRVHGARYATRAEAVTDLFDYIEVFCNRSRRHVTLGYRSPVQFLQDWITAQHEQKITA